MTVEQEAAPTAVAGRTPLVEMRNINVAFGGVHAVRDVTHRPLRRRGHRPRRRQRRRQVDADARAVRRPSRRQRRDPRRRPGRSRSRNPRDAKAYNIETIYQTLALADNIDAPGNMFLGREMTTRLGSLDDSSDGGRDPQGHGSAQPELHELRPAGQVAVRRPAPGGRDRPGGLLQREDPDHGRAHGGARARPRRPRCGTSSAS